MGMRTTFLCGTITVAEAAEPQWGEVAERLALLQQLSEYTSFKFMGAVTGNEGEWQVPFLAASERSVEAVDFFVSRTIPYRLENLAELRVGRLPVEGLAEMRELADGKSRLVCARDLAGVAAGSGLSNAAEEAFSGLVGMDEQRLMLTKLGTAVAKHGRRAVDCLHFVFEGNPGTGKTELAGRLVTYLDRIGVTDGSHRMVQTSGTELAGEYTGQTAPKVRKVIDSARGGLLFIDEFYALSEVASYGREAIDTLTEQLDRRRDDVVCVVAGYPREVERTLELNPGLRDRFGYRLTFPDYTPDQLAQIFCGMAGERGFTVACLDALPGALELLRRSQDFSNARSVRKLVGHAVIEASWAHDEAVITEKDLLVALPQCVSSSTRRPAGF